jgi:hypothetical protein
MLMHPLTPTPPNMGYSDDSKDHVRGVGASGCHWLLGWLLGRRVGQATHGQAGLTEATPCKA